MTDPLERAAIFAGHRRLLAAFRDFGLTDLVGSGEPETLDALRAAVAFLRQEVLPFSHWEEGVLRPDREGWEAAAFEHAFLTVELDALTDEADRLARALDHGTPCERRGALAWVVRRVHRIEAVLELHAGRVEDRGISVRRKAP